MAPAVVAVIGGINMDMVIEVERMPLLGESLSGTSLKKYPGGKGANTAIAVYRSSHTKPDTPSEEIDNLSVFLNGAVGKDDFGTRLLEKLTQDGINISQVQALDSEETATAIIIVETLSGESRCLAFLGATRKWTFCGDDPVRSLADGVKPDLIICHLSVPQEEAVKVLARACEDKVSILLNPSPATYLDPSVYKNVTHLVMNETELAILHPHTTQEELDSLTSLREAGEHFLRLGVQNVVITLGAKGAYYNTAEGESGMIEAEKQVTVVDATGAGDTFIGAYAVEYVQQKRQGVWNIREAIERACKAAAQTIQSLGAQESIPWRDTY